MNATAAVCCHKDDTKANKVAAARKPQMEFKRAGLGKGFTALAEPVSSISSYEAGYVALSSMQMTPRAVEIKLAFC